MNRPIHVNPDAVVLLSTLPEFKHVNTKTLCYRAMRHLIDCKLSVWEITDRVTAIAVILGISKPGQPNERNN